jgi:hypothetical protein
MSSDWGFRNQSELNYLYDIIPSGIHIGPSYQDLVLVSDPRMPPIEHLFCGLTPPNIDLCNPMPVNQPKIVTIDEIEPAWAYDYLSERPKLHVVRGDRLSAYADELVKVSRSIQTVGYHGVLVPLRGGLKPWLQIDVVTEMRFDDCCIPFTQGANGVDVEPIRNRIESFLKSCPDVSTFKLAIVDTADSGHSSRMMAEIIKSIRTDRKDKANWQVHFYLIFEEGTPARRQPPLSAEIPGKSNHQVKFVVIPHSVPDLISEDWDEALGIKCGWKDGSIPQVYVVPSKGIVAIQRTDGGLRLVESNRLDRYTDILLSEAVSDCVVTHPEYTFSEDIWPKYRHQKDRLPVEGMGPRRCQSRR